MKNFKTIAVALDLSNMDRTVLKYAHHLRSLSSDSTRIYCMHVIPSFVFPGNVVEDLVHGINSPGYKLDEMVAANISKEIEDIFGKKDSGHFEIIVREGQPLKTIVQLTGEVQADLLLLGKKRISEGSGIVAKMIARQVDAAVCFVTENATTTPLNVVVPMDFSPCAVRALKQALVTTENTPGSKIYVLHVLDYPPATQYLARNYGLLAPDWEKRIDHAFAACLHQNGIESPNIYFTSMKNEYFDTATHISEYAAGKNADLIVTGAKGHSSFDDFFLGSVTEKLVTIEDQIPVLIVR